MAKKEPESKRPAPYWLEVITKTQEGFEVNSAINFSSPGFMEFNRRLNNWTVIKRFATRVNAEGFIREQRMRPTAKYHNQPLLLVCDPEDTKQMYWKIITK